MNKLYNVKERVERLCDTKVVLGGITKEDADALSIAADMMTRQGKNNAQAVGIISYHARNHTVVLMRDKYTVGALEEAMRCVNLELAK